MARFDNKKFIKNTITFWKVFARNKSAVLGIIIVLFFLVCSLFAPMLTPYSPLVSTGEQLLAPGKGHIMGTDDLSRDIFTQFLFGGRVSFFVGFVAAFFSTIIGVFIGAVSGYFGGWIEDVLQRITEIFSVIPRYFLAMVTVAILGNSLLNITVVIGVLSWTSTARLARAEFSSLKSRMFVDAARMSGCKDSSIIFVEILPNAFPPLIVQSILTTSSAILLEATLSFLGLSDSALIGWGTMLRNAQAFLRQAPWMALFPGIGIFLVILGLNMASDGINQALNPRLRSGTV